MPPNINTESTLQGVTQQDAGGSFALILNKDDISDGFPLQEWQTQAILYQRWRAWFNGLPLESPAATTSSGEIVYKFPLKINPVRALARKHALMLVGEVPDQAPALIDPLVTAKQSLDGDAVLKDEDKRLARSLQAMLNEVWEQSNARTIQMENATVSQFMGGCVFKLTYAKDRDDLRIPVVVENIQPEFFLPVFDPADYYNLLECWIVYKIPAQVAATLYDIKEPTFPDRVIWIEHWTRDKYTITIDQVPITIDGEKIENRENPFGFVPAVYIPHLREGNVYGSSHVPDVAGLTAEYNIRLADLGDAIRATVKRRRYGRNIKTTEVIKLAYGVEIINLKTDKLPGGTAADKPDVFTEDPPLFSPSLGNYTDTIWNQILRDSNMSPTLFGEDEGSQRSALTLALRMWPGTSHARAERAFWTDGKNNLDKKIIKMIRVIKENATGVLSDTTIDEDWAQRVRITQDWRPQIPRDRETMVSEIILRMSANVMSIQHALQEFGDSPDVDDEISEILQWLEKLQKVSAAPEPMEASTNIQTPVAEVDLE